ncbi:MAG: element excision factor XisI family protein [Bacteroidota bacterium]
MVKNTQKTLPAEIITDFLSEYLAVDNQYLEDSQYHLVVNAEQTEFVLIELGWREKRYFNHMVFHLQLLAEEVWIHQNNTDVPIERHLIAAGIRSDAFRVSYLESPKALADCRPKEQAEKMAA